MADVVDIVVDQALDPAKLPSMKNITTTTRSEVSNSRTQPLLSEYTNSAVSSFSSARALCMPPNDLGYDPATTPRSADAACDGTPPY
ncbi:uncharacterized protein ColSpa_00292 [Colletotrichum spaethianum]|uniref:Uncharacterized protein n=1 Tax=Colletotrichum spaethianum TaxID=700344 RepID=A0AA37L1R7_9PEZI|nr:uncharacterized protein ColSpa_00292 [Colletotrichum spaethianum]GKT40111.1 hypothetical protein ColSpa_00292 [Colletotrichum spaethianum]